MFKKKLLKKLEEDLISFVFFDHTGPTVHAKQNIVDT